jgi:drug/metabolite transporter (DMT)-like permease
MTSFPYLGEIFALSTAIVWAFAVILFKKSGETVHPIALNLFKNVLSVILLVPTIWIAGDILLRRAPLSDYGIMLLSGTLGIGVADTLFFMSLNTLGASLAMIVACLYIPSNVLLSVIFLGERLSVIQLGGIALIIGGVVIASAERTDHGIPRKALIIGIACGVLSKIINAAGIVIAKPLLTRSPLLWVTEWRLVGGTVSLLALLVFLPNRGRILSTLRTTANWKFTLFGSFLGAYVSMILWLGGMKFTQVSTASALNQTSNLLAFLFAALLLHEPLTKSRIAGIVLGVAGAYLVTFG